MLARMSQESWFDIIAGRLAQDIDMTLVERQLALTPTQRLEKLDSMMAFYRSARSANATVPEDADRKPRRLERAKRAAGRPKDLLDLGFLEALKKR